MKDILVVAKLKEGKFEKFMGFMQSEQGMNERRKIADLTKTLGTVSPDKSTVMFKIAVHNEDALSSFLDGSNPIVSISTFSKFFKKVPSLEPISINFFEFF